MILGHNEIHNRISKGQVFRKGTSDPSCVKEASYALRVADDGMILKASVTGQRKTMFKGQSKSSLER